MAEKQHALAIINLNLYSTSQHPLEDRLYKIILHSKLTIKKVKLVELIQSYNRIIG